VDLGGGAGCIGRYLANEFGADVDGIDIDQLAVRLADELAHKSRMQHHLRFKAGRHRQDGMD
jgi:methylase of polypeptide subunit release factors